MPDARVEEASARSALLTAMQVEAEIGRKRGFVGLRYNTPQELVFDIGRWFQPRPLPAGRPAGVPGRCFANATAYSARYGLTYAEGYAQVGEAAFEHAWCVEPDGTVHDPTWPAGDCLAYLGVPLLPQYLRQFEVQYGPEARVIFAPHLTRGDILVHGLPEHAIADIGTPLPANTADNGAARE